MRQSLPLATRLNVAIAVLGVLYIVSQTTIGMILHPVGTDLAFRFQLATDRLTALDVLSTWGPEGRAQFIKHFRLDFIHPLLYGGLLWCLLRRFLVNSSRSPILWLPLTAALCDELENLFELRILWQLDRVSDLTVLLSGTLAWTKWSLAALCVLLVAVGIVRTLVKRPAFA